MGKQRLIPLLQWGVAITKDSKGDLSPVAKRNVAIAYAYAITDAITDEIPYSYVYTANALRLLRTS